MFMKALFVTGLFYCLYFLQSFSVYLSSMKTLNKIKAKGIRLLQIILALSWIGVSVFIMIIGYQFFGINDNQTIQEWTKNIGQWILASAIMVQGLVAMIIPFVRGINKNIDLWKKARIKTTLERVEKERMLKKS